MRIDRRQFDAFVVLGVEDAAVLRYVSDIHRAGCCCDGALAAGERDGVKAAGFTRHRGGEINFVAVPGETARAGPDIREARLFSGHVDEGNRTGVVVPRVVIDEGDVLAVGRDAHVAHPAMRFIQDFSEWILEILGGRLRETDCGDLFSIGRPIGGDDEGSQFARRATGRRNFGERALVLKRAVNVSVKQDGEFARRRDAEQHGVRRKPNAARFGAVDALLVNVGWRAVPRRGVDG
jgi:hypothetical protein